MERVPGVSAVDNIRTKGALPMDTSVCSEMVGDLVVTVVDELVEDLMVKELRVVDRNC